MTEKIKVKKPFYKKWWVWLIAIIFIIAIVTPQEEEVTKEKSIATSSEVKKEDKEKKAEEEAKAKEKADAEEKAKKEAEEKVKAEEEAKKTPVQKIESIIIDKIDKKTNMDNDRIVSIEDISEAQDGSYVIAKLNASENFTNNLTKTTIWLDSIEILEPISKLESTKKIVLQWQLPLTDAYGDTKDGQVMTIDLEREQLDKIKWDSFNGENFAVIANNYFEHPAFKE
ncbi:hypothetical protein [Psychrobacillus vulpis]|uniref:Uncharacterized protein n=1 Tax=Psychrobacillus vulpis TaxID=2325572 RepID=A0A544TWK4_9BACI|nr:hypothetical protein [Psychrobacillus vulpis]TQR21833.1 hypothetical protein FG384_02505 [Psychrobacillus vulpis]